MLRILFIGMMACGVAMAQCEGGNWPATQRIAGTVQSSGERSQCVVEKITARANGANSVSTGDSEPDAPASGIRLHGEILCDDYPVADQVNRIPPLCIQGRTCVCRSYPPGFADLALWLASKLSPPLRRAWSVVRRWLLSIVNVRGAFR